MLLDSLERNDKLKLKEIHCAKNNITDEGMEFLCKFFTGMNSLEIVDMSQNTSTNDKGMFHLLQGLIACKRTLTLINISGNHGINDPDNLNSL